MSITAPELFTIVEGVPGEAWPDSVGYGQDFGWTMPSADRDIACVPVELAALMFTGSMVAWLLERGVSVLHIPSIRQFWTLRTTANGRRTSPSSPTLLEALAAACKEQTQ